MKREDVEKILREQKTFLAENYHVKKIGLFGSYTRNEQSGDSDIDILVEFSRPVGFEFIDLKDYLESIFKKPIDLVTENALKSCMKKEILNEILYQ